MKLYTSIGPNPRVVRMFLAEKQVELPQVQVDILEGENRRPPYLDLNPAGSTPLVVLETGQALAETTAICEYIEELQPSPPLIGATPEARALTRMWTRRVDLFIVQPMTSGFRGAEGLGLFKDRVHCLPQAADDLKSTAREGLAWLDKQMADRRPFIAGEAVTLADLMLYSFVEFGALVGQALDPALQHLGAWQHRMAERPSAQATA
jgi:glutathione S-transferase